ncbi:unnamed protein product [Clonostachys rosea]|uniref:Cytochrome P450 n=1 Tax=Bionectria ochroleuca TaxID=29856 RepID=A0ABY6UWC4_BIOOC|nr:unnamed protein product [Clonostachys rosea]
MASKTLLLKPLTMYTSQSLKNGVIFRHLWIPALVCLYLTKPNGALSASWVVLLIQTFLNYAITARSWHSAHNDKVQADQGQLPPQYPSAIPYLGNAVSFAWNNPSFLSKATSYNGTLTASRISFLGFEIFAFQDRQTIAKIWKQSTLSSPISIYVYVLKYFFGLPDDVVSIYRADNSGPFHKSYGGSNVPAGERIDHITHRDLLQSLGGPGRLPTTRRYINALSTRLEQQGISEDWTEMADLSEFFRDIVGSSLIECVFGPTLLRLNPNFMKDLWGFDASVPWLARAVPSFLMPSVYKPRQNCVDQLKRWYEYARDHFEESSISADGDGDPFWGSKLIRRRQEHLLAVPKHDDDALARTDLGLAWGAVGNTIPCTMLSVFHIFKDPQLLLRVRTDMERLRRDDGLLEVDPDKLNKEPLLSSIYAETLRLYVKTYFMVSSPQADVHLGKWSLPRGRIGLMNAGVSHMDKTFWNSQSGQHPVGSFWADRFLTDPRDPQSGPIAPEALGSSGVTRPKSHGLEAPQGTPAPFFSMDGTEGSWFPYGGGHSICPGRVLAKSVILFTSALLASNYDIEIFSDKVEMSTWRFGLGVGELKHALPFRIRRRQT